MITDIVRTNNSKLLQESIFTASNGVDLS